MKERMKKMEGVKRERMVIDLFQRKALKKPRKGSATR